MRTRWAGSLHGGDGTTQRLSSPAVSARNPGWEYRLSAITEASVPGSNTDYRTEVGRDDDGFTLCLRKHSKLWAVDCGYAAAGSSRA